MYSGVVLSINPNWAELILSGKKTLELRKSRPKLEYPYKVYLYETINMNGSGKIVGEFICTGTHADVNPSKGIVDIVDEKKSCISAKDIIEYARNQKKPPHIVYWWHVSEAKRYDKPKELSDLGIDHPPMSWAYSTKDI